jgi:acyl carrier protein
MPIVAATYRPAADSVIGELGQTGEWTMFQTLRKTLSDTLRIDLDQITMDATMEDLEVDSLGMVELSMELEKVFGLRLGDEEMQGLSTVGDIFALLEQRSVAR